MATEQPISPPTADAAARPPPSSTDEPPVSPVHRTGTFQHKTTSAAPVHAFLETSHPAINPSPVEIDGTAAVPSSHHTSTTDSAKPDSIVSPGLGEEQDIESEFLGEGGLPVGREVREKREAELAKRARDPAVLVDIPKEPNAEEVEAARSAEGTVTPGMRAGEFEVKKT
ncbi:hypothetical protein EJ04DRAFT_504313 [Polyplosphaeria fusca]|uniref:Uncharacterized protein n=1 Tax=Polyplosphaeria fusca TaxID=682080 RepID=A0A9P4QMS8_9PLEO|nr:hypothetical protein EJ04DRAFT_504313 [Polyplosphaeria fusca]